MRVTVILLHRGSADWRREFCKRLHAWAPIVISDVEFAFGSAFAVWLAVPTSAGYGGSSL